MKTLGIRWCKMATMLRTSSPLLYVNKIMKKAFSNKYLIYTNVTISVSSSSLGDIMEQKYEIYMQEQEKYDVTRTRHMGVSGIAVGILCHAWYKTLDNFIVGKTVSMVIKKLLLDQLIFSPIMIITFFGSIALFEKNPYENFIEEVQDKFLTLYRAEWMVWPPAQVINFYFLPTKYRVLYDNIISLGYDIYTSQVKHRKNLSKSQEEKDS